MRIARVVGWLAPAVVVVTALGLLPRDGGLTASAADADVMLLATTMGTTPPMQVVPPGLFTVSYPGTVGYNFTSVAGSGCLSSVDVPPASPVSVPVSFVDAPSAGYGTCSDLTGSGTFTYFACATGLATGSLQFDEPGDNVATSINNYAIAFFAGVGMLAASPANLSGGGYVDDGITGSVAGPAVMTMHQPTSCVFGDNSFGLVMALTAEYGIT